MTLKISPVFLALAFAAHADAPAAVNSLAKVGEVEGLTVQIKVQGPSGQDTPLQVACVFEYVEGDLTTPPALPAALNGMLHLDQALHGLIADLRKSGKFKGHALETLLITPPAGEIPAHQLLLIGLGDRKAFSPELMKRASATGMREALRLGVTDYSHASDLKDAGIDSPTKEVTVAVISGALEALRTQQYLADKGAAPKPALRSLTLLAGPSFFADTSAAARELLAH
jgi:Cytosol aminopeptidase family, N-terminal domain